MKILSKDLRRLVSSLVYLNLNYKNDIYKAYDAIIIICIMDLLCNFYFNLILLHLHNKLPEGWTNIPNWNNCIMKMYLMMYNLDLITLWMYLGLGWIIQIEKMCKSSTILTEQNGQFLQ